MGPFRARATDSTVGAVARVLNQRSAQKLLEQHGWRRTTGGKHVVKMVKPGHRPITLPHHQGEDYGRGLTAAILTQAGLEWE
jgi:predicted RNA binding protein YcfA (HicA-like mRNA interferase family)